MECMESESVMRFWVTELQSNGRQLGVGATSKSQDIFRGKCDQQKK